jgi:hypothetical protein
MRGFLVTAALNALAFGLFFAWACSKPAIPPVSQADRDCATMLAVFAVATKAGDECDHALALARLAGPACGVAVQCVDGRAIGVPSVADVGGE